MRRWLLTGTFDRLHVGHQWLLARSCAFCFGREAVLYVIIAHETSVLARKGLTPTDSQAQRKKNVQKEIGWYAQTTEVTLGQRQFDPIDTIKTIRPDGIILGYDQTMPERLKTAFPDLKTQVITPYHEKAFKSSRFRV